MKPFGSTIRTLLLLGLVGQVSVNCYADRNSNLLPRIGEMKRACEAPPSLWDRILGRTPASLEAPSPELGLPWGQVNQRMAMKEALNHPGLLGLGEGNPMGRLCTNFPKMSVPQRQQVLAKTAMSLGMSESNLNPRDHGDEKDSLTLARGVFQISNDTRNPKRFNCKGDLVTLNPSSVSCVYTIFDKVGVVSSHTHWSNLMPQFTKDFNNGRETVTVVHPFERRFLPIFTKYVRECHSDYRAEAGPSVIKNKASATAPTKSRVHKNSHHRRSPRVA